MKFRTFTRIMCLLPCAAMLLGTAGCTRSATAEPDRSTPAYRKYLTDNFAAGRLSDSLLNSVSPGVLALLSECMYFEDTLQKGIAAGQTWVYSNNSAYVPQKGYFDTMVAGSRYGANCAMAQGWALIDMGVVKNGIHLYGDKNCQIAKYDILKPAIDEVADIVPLQGVTFASLYEKGEVEPGDIFFACGHTFLYLGDEKFMATGYDAKYHTDPNAKTEDSRKGVFESFVVDMKSNTDYQYTVYWRMRFKDSYIPHFYRNAAGELAVCPLWQEENG